MSAFAALLDMWPFAETVPFGNTEDPFCNIEEPFMTPLETVELPLLDDPFIIGCPICKFDNTLFFVSSEL